MKRCSCGIRLAGYRYVEDDDGGTWTVWHVADFAGPEVFADSRDDVGCYLTGDEQPEHDVLTTAGRLLVAGEHLVQS